MVASSSHLRMLLFQIVLVSVRMEGHCLKETAHVTVQLASVGTTVKVSAL